MDFVFCAGYMFSLTRAWFLILIATAYAVYCVNARVGFHGVFLLLNLSFISSGILNELNQGYNCNDEGIHVEEEKKSEQVMEDFPVDCENSCPTTEAEDVKSSKSACTTPKAASITNTQKDASSSKVVVVESASLAEMKRIMNCSNHYEVLGLLRDTNVDPNVLKKEYHKKVSNFCYLI